MKSNQRQTIASTTVKLNTPYDPACLSIGV